MRHAIYFTPPEGSDLEYRAAAWLGRDSAGRPVSRPDVPGFTAWRLDTLTAAPRHYGFHATLKPPFSLAEGMTTDGLIDALKDFTAARAAFDVPRPHVAPLNDFLCLRTDSVALDDLAADCVRAVDAFRAPESPEEMAKRRAGGLSRRQEEMLVRWGYPYVMDQFRFHMTLTNRIPDDTERAALAAWLSDWLAPALRGPMTVPEIALYTQADRAAPFTLTRLFAFHCR
ncbi:MAG: hypothetical protein VR70_16145 [Rhodospirillaceae bacterium BRH_c57]|nr:MAG: hypothetical protein VR70_16145 [Rhodospirillaceae bacterium BRH_c57]